MKNRNEIDKKYTWNLIPIYKNIEVFNKNYKMVEDKILSLKSYESDMMSSSKKFYECVKLSFEIERIIHKLYCYASLSFDLDTSNNSFQELCERVSNLGDKYSKVAYFIVPSILKCDYKLIEDYYNEIEKLKEYKESIDEIYRYKDHTLSDKEEKILSSIGRMKGNSYNTYELLHDCDMSFNKIKDENGKYVELTNSNYSLYIESKNRNVRKSAFNEMYKQFKKYSNTYASLLSSNMKELSTISNIEKYDSAIERSLYADNVNLAVYNNLIDGVHNNISYLYDYYDLKKKTLGLKDFHLYDAYVPMKVEFNKKYSYEDAKKVIIEVLNVFGDEYINKVKEALDNRWIDVYPTKNKRTGGYSGGSYDTFPYILLNYQDKYNDMSTLIHEMGHSMHSYYSRTYNSYQNSEYKILVAEVASTVNELLLSHYLLEHSNDAEEKKFILNNLLELYKATIYRQTMFAEFERDISKIADNDGALTSDKLCDMYYELNKFYFGKGVTVDNAIRYEWERIPHFYYDFYVYKYATGLSAATVIVNKILSKEENAIENYIEFLKCGSRISPLESLKIAGVDLTDSSVIDKALCEFKNYIELYKELSK